MSGSQSNTDYSNWGKSTVLEAILKQRFKGHCVIDAVTFSGTFPQSANGFKGLPPM